jgi:hypothetical protein
MFIRRLYLLSQWFLIPGFGIVGGVWRPMDRRAPISFSSRCARRLHTLGTGSGDTMLSHLSLAWQSAVALIAGLIWTVADRNASRETLHQ